MIETHNDIAREPQPASGTTVDPSPTTASPHRSPHGRSVPRSAGNDSVDFDRRRPSLDAAGIGERGQGGSNVTCWSIHVVMSGPVGTSLVSGVSAPWQPAGLARRG